MGKTRKEAEDEEIFFWGGGQINYLNASVGGEAVCYATGREKEKMEAI